MTETGRQHNSSTIVPRTKSNLNWIQPMMFFEPSERIPIFGDESYAHGVPNPFLCRVSPLWDCNWYSKDLDNPQFDQDLMLGFHQSYYIMNHDWKHTENVHISTYGFCSFSSLVSNVHPVIRTFRPCFVEGLFWSAQFLPPTVPLPQTHTVLSYAYHASNRYYEQWLEFQSKGHTRGTNTYLTNTTRFHVSQTKISKVVDRSSFCVIKYFVTDDKRE